MRVTIKLFGRLHDLAGATALERELAGASTVATAWTAIVREWPAIAAYGGSVSAAVNADFAKMTTPIADGDEVAFLPPVSGG